MGLLKMLNLVRVTSTTEEDALARAARERDEACSELRARMRKNEVYVSQNLAKTATVGEHLKVHSEALQARLNDSVANAAVLHEFARDVHADIILEEHKPQWEAAISAFSDIAQGEDLTTDKDNADIDMLAESLCKQIALGASSQDEPTSFPVAVILYHPLEPISSMLKVIHAEGEMGLRSGMVMRAAKQSSNTSKAVWSVIQTGNPLLNNPHGHSEAQGLLSVVPLYASNRSRLGVIVSGPPAVPDELLERFARTAGQYFERSGRGV